MSTFSIRSFIGVEGREEEDTLRWPNLKSKKSQTYPLSSPPLVRPLVSIWGKIWFLTTLPSTLPVLSTGVDTKIFSIPLCDVIRPRCRQISRIGHQAIDNQTSQTYPVWTEVNLRTTFIVAEKDRDSEDRISLDGLGTFCKIWI